MLQLRAHQGEASGGREAGVVTQLYALVPVVLDGLAASVERLPPGAGPPYPYDLPVQPYGTEVLQRLTDGFPGVRRVVAMDDVGGVGGLGGVFAAGEVLPGSPGDHCLVLWDVKDLAVAVLRWQWAVPVSTADFVEVTRAQVSGCLPLIAAACETSLRAATGEAGVRCRALWSNCLYVFECGTPDGGPAPTAEWADRLTPRDRNAEELVHGGDVVRVATNVCVFTERVDDGLLRRVLGVTAAQHVCWAAALLYERDLDDAISPLLTTPPRARRLLEGTEAALLALWRDIRRFRLQYSAIGPHLDGIGSEVWRRIEVVWKVPTLHAVLDERLEFTRQLYEQTAQQVASQKASRLNELVLVFTFLSIFGLCLATMTFLALPSLGVLRVTVLATALSLAMTAFAYAVYRAVFYR